LLSGGLSDGAASRGESGRSMAPGLAAAWRKTEQKALGGAGIKMLEAYRIGSKRDKCAWNNQYIKIANIRCSR